MNSITFLQTKALSSGTEYQSKKGEFIRSEDKFRKI